MQHCQNGCRAGTPAITACLTGSHSRPRQLFQRGKGQAERTELTEWRGDTPGAIRAGVSLYCTPAWGVASPVSGLGMGQCKGWAAGAGDGGPRRRMSDGGGLGAGADARGPEDKFETVP